MRLTVPSLIRFQFSITIGVLVVKAGLKATSALEQLLAPIAIVQVNPGERLRLQQLSAAPQPPTPVSLVAAHDSVIAREVERGI